MPFKLIAPVDAAGLDYRRPVDQRLWNKLTNVWFNNGFLETRPGLRPVGPLSQDITSRRAGIITAIREARNWSAEASSVGAKQRLAPTSTIANTGWTITGAATVHQAIDDTDPPDDYTTEVHATASGSTFSVGFANLAGTPDFIDDLTIHVRAVSGLPQRQSLQLYSVGGAATLIAEIELTNTDYLDGDSAAQDGFVDYYIPVPASISGVSFGTGLAWNVTAVDGFALRVDLVTEASPALMYALGTATGSDDDFTPAGNGWIDTAADTDRPVVFSADRATIVEGDIGDRKSVTFDGTGSPFSTVTSITPRFVLAKRGLNGASVTVYFKSGGTRYTLATAQKITRRYDASIWDDDWGWTMVEVTSTTNPATGAAWTNAQIVAGLEFGIEVENFGDGDVVFTNADLEIVGTSTTGSATVTQVELIVSTRDSAAENPQVFLGRVMATTSSFQRLERQSPSAGADLVDILGAATAPTANWANWSVAEFFGQIYFETSLDTTYRFAGGAAAAVTQLTAPLPLGHTVWAFAQRLFKGDIIEGGTRTPLRIAHSAIGDANDWTGTTASDFDLTHGGEGRVRLGLPLSAMTSAVFLDKGIYTIHWTGDDSAPFVPRFMDSDTGIVGPRTGRPVLDQAGEATILFLGRGPQGLGVYSFDGSSAQNVGVEIEDELRRLVNYAAVDYSLAWVCPKANLYLLFVPEGGQTMPEQCWVYHIDSGHWTRWEFPFGVSAVGEWTLLSGNDGEGGFGGFGDPTDGERALILGTSFGIPYKLDYDKPSDWVSVPGTRNNDEATDFFTSSTEKTEPSAPREMPIDLDIQTGAITLSAEEDIRRLTTPMRLWATYEDRGIARMTLDLSQDGGKDFNTDNTTNFQVGNEGVIQGLSDDPPRLRETVVDIANPTSARHHLFRLTNNQDESEARQKVKLAKLMVEYEDNGDT